LETKTSGRSLPTKVEAHASYRPSGQRLHRERCGTSIPSLPSCLTISDNKRANGRQPSRDTAGQRGSHTSHGRAQDNGAPVPASLGYCLASEPSAGPHCDGRAGPDGGCCSRPTAARIPADRCRPHRARLRQPTAGREAGGRDSAVMANSSDFSRRSWRIGQPGTARSPALIRLARQAFLLWWPWRGTPPQS